MRSKFFLTLFTLLLLCVSPALAETPGYIQVAPDGTGKKVDQAVMTYGGNTVYRQAITLGDPTNGTNLAAVNGGGRLSVGAPNITITTTNPTAAGTVSTCLASNSSAIYRFIQNTTGTPVWINFGGTAAVGTGTYIGSYGGYEMSPQIGNMDTRAITCISTSSNVTMSVLEGQ